MGIVIFTIAYMLKGGWIFRWESFSKWYNAAPVVAQRIVSAKLMSAIVVFVFALLDTYEPVFSVCLTLAWAIAVAPPIRAECLAVGRVGHWSGEFKDIGFSRPSSIVRALQRGAWVGALLSIVCGTPHVFIPVCSLGFVASYFVAQEIYWRIHKIDSWTYAEPMYGAIIGACYFATQA